MSEEVRENCALWLQERWNGVYVNRQGAFIVPGMRETACFVEVLAATGNGPTIIDIHAPVLRHVQGNATLFEVLAIWNSDTKLGTPRLFTDEHSMPGRYHLEWSYCTIGESTTGDELNYLVATVAGAACDLIEMFKPAFGGMTMQESASAGV